MTETVHIAEMAEKLATELFAEFFWERTGPTNRPWPCEEKERHKKDQHPTDVVYFYDEPYSSARTYVNCDLKSYKKGSITTAAVKEALESLAMQVSCAEKSDEWRKLYIHEKVTPSICGLLFVYNHDGEYEKDFSNTLSSIKPEDLDLPKGAKIFVLGPKEIFWLNNIRCEIRMMRGKQTPEIPAPQFCRFFYPQLVRNANLQFKKAKAATLEMLTSPMIIMECKGQKPTDRRKVFVFYSRPGEKEDEFLYLIDMLRVYGLLDDSTDVTIKALEPPAMSAPVFEKAKQRYIEGLSEAAECTDLAEAVKSVKYESLSEVKTTYSTIELGMKR